MLASSSHVSVISVQVLGSAAVHWPDQRIHVDVGVAVGVMVKVGVFVGESVYVSVTVGVKVGVAV